MLQINSIVFTENVITVKKSLKMVLAKIVLITKKVFLGSPVEGLIVKTDSLLVKKVGVLIANLSKYGLQMGSHV